MRSSVYRDLSTRTAKIDRRQTRYRFDLERDVAWHRAGEPGLHFGPELLATLGVDTTGIRGTPGAEAELQWAFALWSCEEFLALEQLVLRFLEEERADGTWQPGRSIVLLEEEEAKHIHLFRRYAHILRAAAPPDRVNEFERILATRSAADGIHGLDAATYPSPAVRAYMCWLHTLFFEEYTIWLEERLAAEPGIQPTWKSVNEVHRREEEQHVVTDSAHLEAVELDDAERARWSKIFVVGLGRSFDDVYGLTAVRRYLARIYPGIDLGGTGATTLDGPFFREVLTAREFRKTRAAAPYLEELAGGGGPRKDGIGRRIARVTAGLFGGRAASAAAPGRVERFRFGEPAAEEPAPPPTTTPAGPARAATIELVREIWAEVLGHAVAPDASFVAAGGDSQAAVAIHGVIEGRYGRTIDHRILLDCATPREFAAWLDRHVGDVAVARPLATTVVAPAAATGPRIEAAADPGHDVAIVGATCRLPGARDLDAFWDLLRSGRDAFADPPADRFDERARREMGGRRGAWLDDVRGFDPAAFGIDRAEAAAIDPQQRLFLELASELLDVERTGSREVGVFVGTGWNSYFHAWGADASRIGPATALGNLENMVAARVAQHLRLTGPALTINAACASSLVAVHLACRAVRDGECEVAVAGGVELNLTVIPFLLFGASGVLAETGRGRPYGRDAAGFVPGEGAGAVLLKPLARARADGDVILAVVKGSAINNDGGALSGMAPSPRGQVAVLRRAYADAGVDPARVSYVEGHGSATPVGDRVEVRALETFFDEGGGRRPPGSRGLGSVKSNVGHLFSAAGITGLLKVVLALRHRELPPTLGGDDPAPGLGFERGSFRPVGKLVPWATVDDELRLAGVSAFGVGGTNCHVVLEEAPAPADGPATRDAELLVGSSRVDLQACKLEYSIVSPK